MDEYTLLALSGSLRKGSHNSTSLQALKSISPDHIHIEIGRINDLPLFNPDLDESQIPALNRLTAQLDKADGLIIASPEYAHGISAPMKNALDWLVSSVEFPYMPVMLINTSPRAHHAMDALKEVLNTMSSIIIDSAEVTIPLLSSNLDEQGIAQDHNISQALLEGVSSFCHEIERLKHSKPQLPRLR